MFNLVWQKVLLSLVSILMHIKYSSEFLFLSLGCILSYCFRNNTNTYLPGHDLAVAKNSPFTVLILSSSCLLLSKGKRCFITDFNSSWQPVKNFIITPVCLIAINSLFHQHISKPGSEHTVNKLCYKFVLLKEFSVFPDQTHIWYQRYYIIWLASPIYDHSFFSKIPIFNFKRSIVSMVLHQPDY